MMTDFVTFLGKELPNQCLHLSNILFLDNIKNPKYYSYVFEIFTKTSFG